MIGRVRAVLPCSSFQVTLTNRIQLSSSYPNARAVILIGFFIPPLQPPQARPTVDLLCVTLNVLALHLDCTDGPVSRPLLSLMHPRKTRVKCKALFCLHILKANRQKQNTHLKYCPFGLCAVFARRQRSLEA